MPEQRFLLTIAYQAGPDPRIQRGADGYKDYFSSAELEKAAWSLLRSGTSVSGLFHLDGTEGAAEIVESMIWRADSWLIKAVDGTEVTVKAGDWLAGLLLDQPAWDLYKRGRIGGVSPQGAAKRRRPNSPLGLAKEFVMAKSVAPGESDEDEWTELYDAQVPRLDLVGKGANGMPFLIAKGAHGPTGLFGPEYVRDLIAKSQPTTEPQEAVTLSGSPAAVAELIRSVHGSPVRKAEPAPDDGIEKADLSTKDLNDLPDSAFAYIEPGGKKDSEGKTTPRKLRHFAIHDKEHADNAASRIAQGAKFGDKAKAKVQAAQRKFGEDVSKEIDMAVVTGDTDSGIDGMDPTVVLAEPDTDAPGDPMEPGTPAWEAIDAATARKWTSIAVRIKNALGVMADRELLEAASGDPDDAEAAWDLQDAQCAIDYVIDTLAGFAVGEQAEADLGGEAMDALGKALGGFDTAALDTIESLTLVRKAGRVLSAANEAAIRGAVESLQKVLASLPAAPATDEESGLTVAKTANEEPNMPEPTTSAETTDASGQQPAMGAAQPAATPPAGTVVSDVAKAKGDPQLVVYDESGKLLGIVDPGDLTPVANSTAAEPDDDGGVEAPDEQPADTPAADTPPTDLTPAPPAEVGTPADAVPDDDAAMSKSTDTTSDVSKSTIEGLLKAALQDFGATQARVLKAALDERDRARGEQIEELAKSTTATIDELRKAKAAQDELIAKQAEQITALENAPAVREVVRNGALPPDHLLRGQQHGAATVDVAKAQERRAALYASHDAREQKAIADGMQADAIAAYQAMRAGAPR